MGPKGLPTPQTKLVNKYTNACKEESSLIHVEGLLIYPFPAPKANIRAILNPEVRLEAEPAFISSLLCFHLSCVSPPTSASFIQARSANCWSACNPSGFCQHRVLPCSCFLCKTFVFFHCLFFFFFFFLSPFPHAPPFPTVTTLLT